MSRGLRFLPTVLIKGVPDWTKVLLKVQTWQVASTFLQGVRHKHIPWTWT